MVENKITVGNNLKKCLIILLNIYLFHIMMFNNYFSIFSSGAIQL